MDESIEMKGRNTRQQLILNTPGHLETQEKERGMNRCIKRLEARKRDIQLWSSRREMGTFGKFAKSGIGRTDGEKEEGGTGKIKWKTCGQTRPRGCEERGMVGG